MDAVCNPRLTFAGLALVAALGLCLAAAPTAAQWYDSSGWLGEDSEYYDDGYGEYGYNGPWYSDNPIGVEPGFYRGDDYGNGWYGYADPGLYGGYGYYETRFGRGDSGFDEDLYGFGSPYGYDDDWYEDDAYDDDWFDDDDRPYRGTGYYTDDYDGDGWWLW